MARAAYAGCRVSPAIRGKTGNRDKPARALDTANAKARFQPPTRQDPASRTATRRCLAGWARRETAAHNQRVLHVVLHQPEIPPNTGNVIRLCANSGARLHLIRPLGFELDNARLRRAGLDYHEFTELHVHEDWPAFVAAVRPPRVFAFSTRGTRLYTTARYADGDALLFGAETRGLPSAVLDTLPEDRRLRLPMQPGNRSLNLSNAVAVVVYEAWRQHGFAGDANATDCALVD